MAEYRQSNGETASWRLKQLYIVDLMVPATWITVVILELIHASKPDFAEGLCLLEQHQLQALLGHGVIHDNLTNRVAVLKFLWGYLSIWTAVWSLTWLYIATLQLATAYRAATPLPNVSYEIDDINSLLLLFSPAGYGLGCLLSSRIRVQTVPNTSHYKCRTSPTECTK